MSETRPAPIPPDEEPSDGGLPARYESAYAPGRPAQGEVGEPPLLQRYLPAFFRYKWILGLAVVLGVGATYAAWTQMYPEYEATGALWIQAEEGGGERGPIVTEGLFQASSWLDLLQSHAVLDTVVIQNRLYVTPEAPADRPLFAGFELADSFVPGLYQVSLSQDGTRVSLLRDGTEVDRAGLGEPLGDDLGFRWLVEEGALERGEEVEFTVRTPRNAATLLREALRTQMDPAGTFVHVSLRERDPELAATSVNAILDRHVELAEELKTAHLNEQIDMLEQQLLYAQQELEEGERALEDFRINTITLPSDDARPIQPGLEMTRDPVFSEFFQMRIDQDQLRRDRERLERILETAPDSGLQIEAIEFVPSAVQSSQISEALATLMELRAEHRTLLDRYTPDHPPVMELAESIETLEEDRIPMLLSQLVERLRAEEEDLAARISASESDLTEIPARTIEEARLRRQVVMAETLYTDLRSRYEEATLARASSLSDVRILDRAAVPEFPTNDERLRLVAMIFAAFVGAGLGGVLLADRMDSRFRTPDQVLGGTGLVVLGAIPHIRHSNGKSGSRNANQVHEAFRELRTNIGYAHGAAGPMMFTVSSPGMNEGKTLVSTNLAVSFARLGRRTVIVDGDTRRGDLHHFLGVRRRPGLTEYLSGDVPLGGVLQRTTYENLRCIGSGAHVPHSPELLQSSRMGELLVELRKQFDVIIVDSPPLGAGPDPLILASATGHILLVIRSGTTDREFTQAKLEPLGRIRVRGLGAVLNDYEPNRLGANHYRYYGAYLPGYEAGDEDEAHIPTQLPPMNGDGAAQHAVAEKDLS